MQIRLQEAGRSMVEILGVLAIIGVLTILAIGGYRYAFNKNLANQIYKDIKLVQINLITQADGVPYEWEEFKQDLLSPYVYFVRRDKAKNNFVLVEAVEQAVCIHLNRLAQNAGEITLYTLDNEPLECMLETQEVVVSFNGDEPLIPCESYADCPQKEGSYCNETEEICQMCAFDERVNDEQDGCVDLCEDRADEKITSCKIEAEEIGWCCRYDEFCSETQAGECVPSDGTCIYKFFDNDSDLIYKTDCSYHVGISEVMERYSTDCSYLVGTADVVEKYTTDCSYTLASNGNMSVDKKCDESKYCVLNWTDDEWTDSAQEPKVKSESSGTIYGKCQMLSTFDTSPITTFTEGTGLVYKKQGCLSDKQYCVLNWTDDEWMDSAQEPKIKSESSGMVYGKCQILSTFDTSPITTFSEGAGLVYKKQGCASSDYYCVLNWTKPVWDSTEQEPIAPSNASGVVYGTCQVLTTNDATPYFERNDGKNKVFSVAKKCPPRMYCNLHWADEMCTVAQSSIKGKVYGVCALWDETNADCPNQDAGETAEN